MADDEAMRWAKAREHELRTRALDAAMESGDYGDWLLDDALYAQVLWAAGVGMPPRHVDRPHYSAGGVIRGPEGFEMLASPAGRYAADLTDPVANAQAAARYLHERYGQVRRSWEDYVASVPPDGIRDPRLWD